MIGYHPEVKPDRGVVPGSPVFVHRRDDELIRRVVDMKRRMAAAEEPDHVRKAARGTS